MFISYALNFEDVLLWRALKHVEEGFYIDVGANDPVIDSTSKAFYDQGWAGVTVEPLVSHHTDLQAHYPRNINLCCVAGARSGEIDLWECDVRGWATVEKAIMEQHERDGHPFVHHRVPVRTLADICTEYVTGEIHFLKVDVEGFEKSVLTGADFQRYRPWIVVVESTAPNSARPVYEAWEPLLLSNRYQFVYADGLNRFYLAEEHAELGTAFVYPPNIFDGFIRFEHLQALVRANEAEKRADQTEKRANTAEKRANHADNRLREAQTLLHHQRQLAGESANRLHAIEQSVSWRITSPLRLLFQPVCQPAASVASITKIAVRFVALILDLTARLLAGHPKLWAYVLATAHRLGLTTVAEACRERQKNRFCPSDEALSTGASADPPVYLSPRVRMIYVDLKTAIRDRVG